VLAVSTFIVPLMVPVYLVGFWFICAFSFCFGSWFCCYSAPDDDVGPVYGSSNSAASFDSSGRGRQTKAKGKSKGKSKGKKGNKGNAKGKKGGIAMNMVIGQRTVPTSEPSPAGTHCPKTTASRPPTQSTNLQAVQW
jgi:hypothetical protein